MLDELRAALAAADWVRALDLALAAWRETRSPALADLVDVIGAKFPASPLVRRRDIDAWWLARAAPYDPRAVPALVEAYRRFGPMTYKLAAVVARWGSGHPIIAALGAEPVRRWVYTGEAPIDRLAAMVLWPDDPRAAAILVEILVADQLGLAHDEYAAVLAVVAQRLSAIANRRVLPRLVAARTEPRRGLQMQQILEPLVERAIAAITTRSVVDVDVAPLMAVIPQPVRRDLEPLWREVAAHPDDVGPRTVLGDALVEDGDLRGDLIVLQCHAKAPGRPLRGADRTRSDGRVRTIARRQWQRWLGDATLVLQRNGCEFRNGMLEIVRIGRPEIPPWVWPKVRGHRELACVHTVRPGDVSPADYALFVANLPRDPRTLGISTDAQVDALAALRPRMTTRALEFFGTIAGDPFDRLARLLPELEEALFVAADMRADVPRLAAALPLHFPRLRRIAIPALVAGSNAAHLATFPLVEVVG